ncbi:hypothetical protein [Dyella flagellata]|uniref:Uncharacterized protein n=1 Tax=Dyella flagellata TaxID=1867833 RepID=A0ABQ5XGX4_9GAMM|nr:hypothetical protein [Dyella flagellata]GLQ90956.1 hypothetical protein GCM10007898_45320 [Dyella flagellata]
MSRPNTDSSNTDAPCLATIKVYITYHPFEKAGFVPEYGPGYHWKFQLEPNTSIVRTPTSPQLGLIDPLTGLMEISKVNGSFSIKYELHDTNKSEHHPPLKVLEFVSANISTNLANGAVVNNQIGGIAISQDRRSINVEYRDEHQGTRKFGVILVAMNRLQPYFAICSPDPQVICHNPQ